MSQATSAGVLLAVMAAACHAGPQLSPEQRMQQDLGFLSTREFMSLDASGSFGAPLRQLPQYGESPTTSLRLLWTGRSGWIARASIPGHGGDCVMAGGLIPESAFVYTSVRHKGADPEDVVCDNSMGPGTADWHHYVERFLALPLEHAVRSYSRAHAEGRPMSADSAVQPRVVGFSGLHRELLWSGPNSWAAQTWLADAPERSCVVWFGTRGEHPMPVTRAGLSAGAPAVVVCDTVESRAANASSRAASPRVSR